MDDIFAWIAATEVAQTLRQSRWSYAAINTLHILGLSLLVGAILPLDLRLLGLWRSIDRTALVRVLAPSAAAGLATAVVSGALLFSIRAPEYAENPAFLTKIGLVGIGTASALVHHLRHGATLTGASTVELRIAGAVSAVAWIGAIASGRLIAFIGD